MNALFVFPYNNCFLSDTGKDLNCRKEDEHKHEMAVDKNNRKSLQLKLRNIEKWYFLQLFMFLLVMNTENKIWRAEKRIFCGLLACRIFAWFHFALIHL
jgi:uncharacterized membrane protein